MKIKRRITVLSLLMLLILFSSFFYSEFWMKLLVKKNLFNEKNKIKVKFAGYWDLTGTLILIDGNSEWATTASSQPWCNGSGTWSDPYIIENVTIDGQNSGNCIEIKNSNVHFIIRNSILYNAGSTWVGGIRLNNVSKSKIINNKFFSNNNEGIILERSTNNTIANNNVTNNLSTGLRLYLSDNNLVFNNSLTGNVNGILIDYGNQNMILRNDIDDNSNSGISLEQCIDHNISLNTIINNGNGINLISSNDNYIQDNTINFNSLCVNLENSNNNFIIYNNVENNQAFFNEDESSQGNIFEFNEGYNPQVERFPFEIILTIIIICVAVVIAIGTALVFKKKKSGDREEKIKRKKEKEELKVGSKLRKKLTFIDYLISENKIDIAIKNLEKVKAEADNYDILEIFNKASKKLEHCDELERELAIKLEKEKELILEKEKEKEPKFKVFLSYSTLDSDHFQISKIVEALEKYPKIDRVLFWEADSSQNIVQYMEETLKTSNVFVLFCSENSSKSGAVRDEWQAAFQRRKQGLISIIPVYEKEEHIPILLMPILNVKYSKKDFKGFIEKLHEAILREL